MPKYATSTGKLRLDHPISNEHDDDRSCSTSKSGGCDGTGTDDNDDGSECDALYPSSDDNDDDDENSSTFDVKLDDEDVGSMQDGKICCACLCRPACVGLCVCTFGC